MLELVVRMVSGETVLVEDVSDVSVQGPGGKLLLTAIGSGDPPPVFTANIAHVAYWSITSDTDNSIYSDESLMPNYAGGGSPSAIRPRPPEGSGKHVFIYGAMRLPDDDKDGSEYAH